LQIPRDIFRVYAAILSIAIYGSPDLRLADFDWQKTGTAIRSDADENFPG